MMRRALLIAATLVCIAVPGIARVDPAAQQLLDSATKPADLFEHGTKPFELLIHVSAQLSTPTEGDLLIRWKAPDQWWSKVVLGSFQQITIRNGEEEYTLRNGDITSVVIQDLFRLVPFRPNMWSPFRATKRRSKTLNGFASLCVEAVRANYKSDVHELCFDASYHTLLSDDWHNFDKHRRQEFSNYADFKGARFPRTMQLALNGRLLIAAEVVRLQFAAFDPALLIPPEGAIARRNCPNLKTAVILKRVWPDYGLVGHPKGEVRLSVTVLPDGSVSDARVLGSGGRVIDPPALAALKQWKFKPAMCGDEPVTSDVEVEFSFSLH